LSICWSNLYLCQNT